jgi:hypothetical protein
MPQYLVVNVAKSGGTQRNLFGSVKRMAANFYTGTPRM